MNVELIVVQDIFEHHADRIASQLQLGELLRLSLNALCLAPQPQPGAAARRQELARRLKYAGAGQGLPRAVLSRGETLRLTQAADIGHHGTITLSG
jgi:hypothetical protein